MNLTEKYIEKLKGLELVYTECQQCDSGTVKLDDAIQTLREFEAEIISQILKTDINYGGTIK
jgi:hypothetical protein